MEIQHWGPKCQNICLSIMLSPKPLGGILPSLLHHFPLWEGCASAILFFCVHSCICYSLREIFPTDAGQLSNRLKFLAGQINFCRTGGLCVIKLLSLFARNHRTFVRQTEIFCRTDWKFASFVRQSCSFCEDCCYPSIFCPTVSF